MQASGNGTLTDRNGDGEEGPDFGNFGRWKKISS